jgi:hypothetical protein
MLISMLGKKHSILYYDDQQTYRERFFARHGEYFEIDFADDISGVLDNLEQRSKLPDLLVLDLYHDIDRSDPDQNRRVTQAKAALDELNEMLRRVKAKVDSAWRPDALETLVQVREQFSARVLPILVYSQRGLFFLEEGQVKEVEDAHAHWMLKDKGAHYEAARMRRIVKERPRRRLARDVTIATVSVLAGAILSLVPQILG